LVGKAKINNLLEVVGHRPQRVDDELVTLLSESHWNRLALKIEMMDARIKFYGIGHRSSAFSGMTDQIFP
jgi:hypothetical protein